MAFKTENVNARVDFTTRKGQFKSHSGESFVVFPDNQYICYMDQFNWYMDNDDLEMESNQRVTLTLIPSLTYQVQILFDSSRTRPLNFKSPKARFDIKKKRITCDRVPLLLLLMHKFFQIVTVL